VELTSPEFSLPLNRLNRNLALALNPAADTEEIASKKLPPRLPTGPRFATLCADEQTVLHHHGD
jgi:hypothetical protein